MIDLWFSNDRYMTDIWKWQIYNIIMTHLWQVYDCFMQMTVLWQIYDRYMTDFWDCWDPHSIRVPFLQPTNIGQSMHSPTAMTEQPSPNSAGTILLHTVYHFRVWS